MSDTNAFDGMGTDELEGEIRRRKFEQREQCRREMEARGYTGTISHDGGYRFTKQRQHICEACGAVRWEPLEEHLQASVATETET